MDLISEADTADEEVIEGAIVGEAVGEAVAAAVTVITATAAAMAVDMDGPALVPATDNMLEHRHKDGNRLLPVDRDLEWEHHRRLAHLGLGW